MFRIEGVPNGRWIADAFSPGYTSPGGVELDAGRGVPELALVRGATIEGRVLDGEGRPIEGATVRALTGEGTAAQEQSAAVDQDRLRRFSGRTAAPALPVTGLLSDDPSFIPRGELGVTVGPIPPIPPPGARRRAAGLDRSHRRRARRGAGAAARRSGAAVDLDDRRRTGGTGSAGCRRARRRCSPPRPGSPRAARARSRSSRRRSATGIDITLTPGTILVGKVTDQHKVPVIGAQVTARPEVGAAIDASPSPTATYRIGPVTGTVELSASAFGHADAKRTVDARPGDRPRRPPSGARTSCSRSPTPRSPASSRTRAARRWPAPTSR